MSEQQPSHSDRDLRAENAELRLQLAEAEEALQAIGHGEVDAVVVHGVEGPRLFTLQGVDAAASRLRGDMLAQVGDAVIATDPDLRVTYVNAAAERLYGVRSSDVLGASLASLLGSQWPTTDGEESVWAAVRNGDQWRGEGVSHSSEGRLLHVESTISALYGPEGGFTGYLAAIRDVSERAQAETALRAAHDTFHHLVEHSPFGVYAVDADFRLVQASAGAQKVFESVRPLLGRDFAEVLRVLWPEPFASDCIRIFRHTLDTGEPFHAPSTVERRQDIDAVESYDWKTERVTLPDGRHGVVCHFYDLTERQRYEAALREADRQKDEFLAMLAHELRNPLAPIRTAAGILRMRGPADPLVVTCADTIDRQTTQMARLLDDLLDVSRLSRGKLTLQRAPVLVDEILRAAAETSRPLIDQQGQHLGLTVADQGLLLDGDTARLIQVFANLLNNAAKFSPQGARIEVVVRRDGDRVAVRVRDAGIGIAPDMLDRVFDLFTQGSNDKHHSPGGLGIGLSLARRLVELHGGTINAASAGIDRGSEFTVTLPLATTKGRLEKVAADRATMSPLNRRVLVIDDNVDAADTTAMLLSGQGCDVRTAYDGETGLRAADAFRPDVVLLDLGLPDIDGHQVSRRIRGSAWGKTTQLIAVSGWGREEDRQRSSEAGFDRHLTKPVKAELLIQLVRDVRVGERSDVPGDG